MQKTDWKGALAIAKVKLRAVEKGIGVSTPDSPLRYDLVMDIGGELKKVQVKYGDGTPGKTEGAVVVKTSSNYHSKSGYREVPYKKGEVDLILAYIPKIDKIIALEPKHFVGKPRCLQESRSLKLSNPR